MVDLRKIWPDVPDEVIALFPRLTPKEWFILERIWNQRRFVNAEISEDDLLMGFPKSIKASMRCAVDSLVKTRLLSRESKQTVFVYKGDLHHEIFKQPGIDEIFNEVRSNRKFRDALKFEEIEVRTIPERDKQVILKILETSKKKPDKTHLIDYEVLGPLDHASPYMEGGCGAKVKYVLECPRTKKRFGMTAEVESVHLMFQCGKDMVCPWCNRTHHVKFAGRLEF